MRTSTPDSGFVFYVAEEDTISMPLIASAASLVIGGWIVCQLFALPPLPDVRVRGQTGDELFLKVKQTTPMLKVFKAYASRKGVSVSALRFLIDGDRVDPDKTPESLGLEEHDQIDCMLNQNGGGRDKAMAETER